MDTNSELPQPEKGGNKRATSLVIVGVVSIVIGIVLICLLIVKPTFTQSPLTIVQSELAYIKAHDLQSGYKLTSKKFQSQTSFTSFERLTSANPLSNYKNSNFPGVSVKGNVALVIGVIKTTDDKEFPIRFDLIKEANTWKIQYIQFNQYGKDKDDPPRVEDYQTNISKPSLQATSDMVKECWSSKAVMTVPKDWYFKEEMEKATQACFITKESIDTNIEYYSGVSINIMKDVKKNTGELPSKKAQAISTIYKQSYSNPSEVMESTEQTFKNYTFDGTINSDTNGLVNIRVVLKANDTTDTLYIITAEAPKKQLADWEKVKNIVHDATFSANY